MRSSRLLFLIPLLGCSFPAPDPPAAEFLVADASTTYWVKSTARGISARTSPLILTRADNRFYEVYVGEVTRSYEDAIFIREPIYRRDVLNGNSKLLFEDARISAWEKSYLQRNPDARLLEPEEEVFEEVAIAATGESEILAVAGPYLLFERWATLERDDFQQADSARSAIDIRSGRSIPISALVRDTAVMGAGAEKDANGLRWRHAGYDVVARWDDERNETAIILRNPRGHEWPLGYVDSRLPRIFWLDEPKVDKRLRAALVTAFEDARADDVETHLVNRGGKAQAVPQMVAWNR